MNTDTLIQEVRGLRYEMSYAAYCEMRKRLTDLRRKAYRREGLDGNGYAWVKLHHAILHFDEEFARQQNPASNGIQSSG